MGCSPWPWGALHSLGAGGGGRGCCGGTRTRWCGGCRAADVPGHLEGHPQRERSPVPAQGLFPQRRWVSRGRAGLGERRGHPFSPPYDHGGGAERPPAGAEPFSVPPPTPQDAVSSKLQGSNIFTIAKRNVEGQDMLYQSLKLTNGIWVLAELRIQPSNPTLTVRPPLLPPCRRGGTRGVPLGSPSPQQRDAGSPQPQKCLGRSPLSPSLLPFSWPGGGPWGLSLSLGVQPELLAPHNRPPPPYFFPPLPSSP